MIPSQQRATAAFSLMEVIVATAVLAASGAALFALIGQASQLARRAEIRSEALQIAESVLDEALAMPGQFEGDVSGTVESNPRWDFAIEQQVVESALLPRSTGEGVSGSFPATSASESPNVESAQMVRWIVSVFPAGSDAAAAAGTVEKPSARLVRWARRGEPRADGTSDGQSGADTESADRIPANGDFLP